MGLFFEAFKFAFGDIFHSPVQSYPLPFVTLDFQSYIKAVKNMHPFYCTKSFGSWKPHHPFPAHGTCQLQAESNAMM